MDISQLFFYFNEYIMHFDKYIPAVMAAYGSLIYFILFLIIFCETGLVVTPLPAEPYQPLPKGCISELCFSFALAPLF